MDVIGVIPARYGSTRLEGKVLADIHGKPMVQRVYERALRAKRVSRVLVATDDNRVVEAVRRFGGNAVITSRSHGCGSDRVAEAVSEMNVRFIVNIQCDEPMLDPNMVDEVVGLLERSPQAGIATLMRRIQREKDFTNPGYVKVVIDRQGMALYFSRSLIPYPKNRPPEFCVYDHVGIYCFTKGALARFWALGPSNLESIEGLEQLRALEHGIPVVVAETCSRAETACVDTPEDLELVRALLAAQAPEMEL